MCVLIKDKDTVRKPGQKIPVYRGKNIDELVEAVWTGAARNERLGWWKRQPGTEVVKVEANAIAERSDDNKEVIWRDIPEGSHLYGVLEPTEPGKSYQKVRIVTVQASQEELDYFRHDRYVLLGPKDAPWANG